MYTQRFNGDSLEAQRNDGMNILMAAIRYCERQFGEDQSGELTYVDAADLLEEKFWFLCRGLSAGE
jgi:hypothetical protein